MKGFFLKILGIVLAIHVVVIGFLWFRSETESSKLEDFDDITSVQALVPLAEVEALPPVEPTGSNTSTTASNPMRAAAAQQRNTLYPLDSNQGVGLDKIANPFDDELRSAILVDANTGKVLFQHDSKKAVPIASMTKMMTALIAFEEIESNPELSFDTVVRVSVAASKIGGSQVWLDPRESFTMRELLISIMVKSANDSAYLVGEYLANGNMKLFVERMNTRALELHMSSTTFYNAHGLTSNLLNNRASCEDLVYLGNELLKHEKAVEWSAMPQYTFRPNAKQPTELRNHNKLVITCPGVDGLKTGYTKDAGFCVTASCQRDGRRLIAVVTGFLSEKRRNQFTSNLFDWGYTQID